MPTGYRSLRTMPAPAPIVSCSGRAWTQPANLRIQTTVGPRMTITETNAEMLRGADILCTASAGEAKSSTIAKVVLASNTVYSIRDAEA